MSVTPAFCPLSLQSLRDQNDIRVVGGKIYVNAAGTTTLITTYADEGMTQANPNPLLSDAYGRIPPIWVGAGNYKIVAQDASGGQLFIVDQLAGGVDYAAQATAAAAAAQSSTGQWQTGDVKAAHGPAQQSGWIVLNGGSIGNAASDASSRANADTMALFLFLWNNDASLAVSNNRGATATADFNAGKTIAVPDYRGRALVGCDQMGGASDAGVITGATCPAIDTVGTHFGAETEALSVAQLPQVAPQITVDGGVTNPGQHTHTATTGNAGGHNHTLTDPQHTHTYIQTETNNFDAEGGTTGLVNLGVHSPAQTTSAASTGITIAPVGDHNHSVTIDSGNPGGSHTHVASSSSFGGNQAHPNVQPSTLVFYHIRL